MKVAGAYLHFRCWKHVVEGHEQTPRESFAKCEVPNCGNRAAAYWYKGEKYQELPKPHSISWDMLLG